MFGTLPIDRPYYNMVTVGFVSTIPPTCCLLQGGKNSWKGVKKPFFYGLTEEGKFIVYVPKEVGIEAFSTDSDFHLDWCAFNSLNQPYWNLGKENSILLNTVHVEGK